MKYCRRVVLPVEVAAFGADKGLLPIFLLVKAAVVGAAKGLPLILLPL